MNYINFTLILYFDFFAGKHLPPNIQHTFSNGWEIECERWSVNFSTDIGYYPSDSQMVHNLKVLQENYQKIFRLALKQDIFSYISLGEIKIVL